MEAAWDHLKEAYFTAVLCWNPGVRSATKAHKPSLGFNRNELLKIIIDQIIQLFDACFNPARKQQPGLGQVQR